MIEIKYREIVTKQLSKGAILNELMEGFKEDYLTLHCLLRKYKIKSVFEIGTHKGTGTMIIKNAIGKGIVYSLDLPDNLANLSEQHAFYHNGSTGMNCNLPYIQLHGDSMIFDYSKYPAEAYFIDGEHTYKHVCHEANQAIKNSPQIIAFHDADMPYVHKAIIDAFEGKIIYKIYRVIDTRIAYALKI